MINKIIILLLFVGFIIFGQLELSVSVKGEIFLPYEPIEADLYIGNLTNQELSFSRYSGTDSISIVVKHSKYGKLREKKLVSFTPITIEAGVGKKLTASLTDYFDIFAIGQYTVTLIIKHKLFDNPIFSKVAEFSLLKGSVKKKQSFGVYDPATNKIKKRNYEISYIRKKIYTYYYLRVFDDDWIYTQIKLAPKIFGVGLADEVDSFGNIHLLIQFKARHYYHYVVSADGELRQKVLYSANTSTIPSLIKDLKSGQVTVKGGVRSSRLERNDG